MTEREDVFKSAMSTGHSAAWDQQWDQAVESYQQALAEFPTHPKALSSLGLALFELQRYDEALQVYLQAARSAPNDPLPLEKAGQLYERLGKIDEAIQAFIRVADLYIKNQDADKAVENWVRVTQLDPEHIPTRSYLAMVHERLGHIPQAVTEYLAVASLLQRSGNAAKTAEMVRQALRLMPNSAEVRQAQTMVKAGQLLPKPMRPQGGTGPLRMAQVKQDQPARSSQSDLDPIAETARLALNRLAELLFDLSEEAGNSQISRHGMQAIMRGSGQASLKKTDLTRILLHISQAIDAQTKKQELQAAEELEKALAAGFTNPAVYFDLGFLRSKGERLESAMRNLQTAVKHEDYALGARLLLAQLLRQLGRLPEAVTEYLEALKIADASVLLPSQADEIRQLYEPLIESQTHQTDTAAMEQLCENVRQLLVRPNWRAQVLQAREQLPEPDNDSPPTPLADILAQASSSQVIETISRVRALARAGHMRTAMDEAFESFNVAPTYLPLHVLVGDLLLQDGRLQDAIAKYLVVAEAYNVRGEASQAVTMLRRILEIAPMDLNVRTRLIELLTARGMVSEAIGEYIDLADIYYRLAELDMARKTYATALHLAQQGGADRQWSIKLMRRMADIDMQRLDWRQALRLFEQLRTLEVDDAGIRKSLIDLNIRLNQPTQIAAELENYLSHLQSSGRRREAIPFLVDLVGEYPKQGLLRGVLAEEYRQANRIPDAIAQLDALGDMLLDAGDRDGAIQAIEAILALNPPNVQDYKILLAKIRSET